MTKYHQPEPGEPVALPMKRRGPGRSKVKSVMYEACCDCGLVHRREITVENGRITERVWRDGRRTAAFRRGKAKRQEIGVEPKSNVYVIMPRINAHRRRRRVRVKYDPY